MIPIESSFLDIIYAQKKEPEWFIKDFAPVGIVFMAGPPKKAYKSTMTVIKACLAAQWDCKAFPPWMRPELFGPSMLFSYEADAGEVLWVIEDGLHIAPKEGYLYVTIDPWEFQLDVEGVVDRLLALLTAKKPRLVIFDPFRNMWSGDENDSGQVIACLGPVRQWLKQNNACGIVVHHINKPSELTQVGSMYSMRGSSAIPGLADGIIVVEATKQEGQVRIHTTFKRGQSWVRTIQLGVPGYGWPSEGYELPGEMWLPIEKLWATTSTHEIDWLQYAIDKGGAKQVGQVREALAGLYRNERIRMDRMEQQLFLGGAR